MVVIAQSTRSLLGSLFVLEDLGAKDLKGIAGPVPAWAVLRASTVESRFEALHSGATSLVGREEEIEVLTRRWQSARAGEGGVVLLYGGGGRRQIAPCGGAHRNASVDPLMPHSNIPVRPIVKTARYRPSGTRRGV